MDIQQQSARTVGYIHLICNAITFNHDLYMTGRCGRRQKIEPGQFLSLDAGTAASDVGVNVRSGAPFID